MPTFGEFSGISRDFEPSHDDDEGMNTGEGRGDDLAEPLSPFIINPEDWKEFMRAVGEDRYSPY